MTSLKYRNTWEWCSCRWNGSFQRRGARSPRGVSLCRKPPSVVRVGSKAGGLAIGTPGRRGNRRRRIFRFRNCEPPRQRGIGAVEVADVGAAIPATEIRWSFSSERALFGAGKLRSAYGRGDVIIMRRIRMHEAGHGSGARGTRRQLPSPAP